MDGTGKSVSSPPSSTRTFSPFPSFSDSDSEKHSQKTTSATWGSVTTLNTDEIEEINLTDWMLPRDKFRPGAGKGYHDRGPDAADDAQVRVGIRGAGKVLEKGKSVEIPSIDDTAKSSTATRPNKKIELKIHVGEGQSKSSGGIGNRRKVVRKKSEVIEVAAPLSPPQTPNASVEGSSLTDKKPWPSSKPYPMRNPSLPLSPKSPMKGKARPRRGSVGGIMSSGVSKRKRSTPTKAADNVTSATEQDAVTLQAKKHCQNAKTFQDGRLDEDVVTNVTLD